MKHKQIRIRSGMFIQLSLLIIFTTLLFFVAVYRIIITPSVKANASNELSLSSHMVDDKLTSFFDEIASVLYISKGYFQTSEPTLDGSDSFVSQFIPVLHSFPHISAIILAKDARELILFQEDDGYKLRVSQFENSQSHEIWRNFDQNLSMIDEYEQVGDYDTRTRPWNIGASNLASGEIFWTNIYTFYTKKVPGITIASPLLDTSGQRRIIAMDISLEYISQEMQSFSVSKNGFIVLFDDNGNLITQPQNVQNSHDALSSSSQGLSSYADSGNLTLIDGYTNYLQKGLLHNQDLFYKSNSVDWISNFHDFTLGGQTITVGLFAPMSDFASIEKGSFNLLLAFTLILLLIAVLLASIVSRWISFPIKKLLLQSESIGRLDFDHIEPIKTRWYEINLLYDAQREMATLLKMETEDQDRIIREKTRELLKFSYVIEQTPISIVITDIDGNIEYVNPHFSTVTGYSLEEALGKNPRILKSEMTPDKTYKELWERITRGEAWYGEFINKKKDGNVYNESVVIIPILEENKITHFVAMKEDITNFKLIEKQLSDQLAFLNQLMDTVPNPIYFKDKELNFIGCNASYEKAFGIRREDISGVEVHAMPYITPELQTLFYEDDQSILSERITVQRELEMLFADGTMHNLLYWKTYFVLSDGTIGGILGVLVDISELKDKEKDLAHALSVAREATEAKSLFLANMSHEIRTPMNAIIGMSYLAMKKEENSKQKDYLHKIHFSANQLLLIINDILDFSKIESGKMQIEVAEFSLEDVVNHAISVTSTRAREKGLEFLCYLPGHIPKYLMGDSHKLSQILINFLSNAVKFTEKGIVSLHIELKSISQRHVILQFKVIDTGIGISQDNMKDIFEAFNQGDNSTTRRFGGTGLGLSISQKLAGLLNAEVSVESELGKGSTFSLIVPFSPSVNKQEISVLFPKILSKQTILVVDGQSVSSEIYMQYLSSMKFDVTIAHSGKQAMEYIQSQELNFTLIIIENQLSDMGGCALAQLIKQDQTIGHKPLILLAQKCESDEDKCDEYIDAIIQKPFTISTLFEHILTLLHPNQPKYNEEPLFNGERFSKLTILLAEDNDINAQIAIELLQSQGAKVDWAIHGQEAIDKVKANQTPYDLILMDIQMPVMDGYQASMELRRLGYTLPIIAMTAKVFSDEKAKCQGAGMNAHIAKPIDPDNLFKTIAQFADVEYCENKINSYEFPPIEGIDTVTGLLRVAQNHQVYSDLLKRFSTTYKVFIPELRLLLRNNREEAKRSLHTLKGTSGNIGAIGIYQLTDQMETVYLNNFEDNQGSKENSEEFNTLINQLEESLDAVICRIEHSLNEEKSVKEIQIIDLNNYLSQLITLVKLLKDADSEALDYYESIKEELLYSQYQGIFNGIDYSIRQFDYETAIIELESLMQKEFTDNE